MKPHLQDRGEAAAGSSEYHFFPSHSLSLLKTTVDCAKHCFTPCISTGSKAGIVTDITKFTIC